MGYAIHARDGAWPPHPPQDGEPIGWHYRASPDECEGGEVYLEELPEGLSEPRWDASRGAPRARTEEELIQEARDQTLERIAEEAAASLSSQFVNPNEVIGLLANVLFKQQNGEDLTAQEQGALSLLKDEYGKAPIKKREIREAPPESLSSISWSDDS